MNIEPITDDTIFCEKMLLSEIASLTELLETRAHYQVQHPDKTVLLTLDEVDQAHYTSGHATHFHDLYQDSDDDDKMPLEQRFSRRAILFQQLAHAATFDEQGVGCLNFEEQELNLLLQINADPMSAIDDYVMMMLVPTQDPSLAISAFPNGYFNGDLSPFDNYALAKHLHRKYGYRLMGIGASLIGFIREQALEGNQALSLGKDLAVLYGNNLMFAERIAAFVQTQPYLFLAYAEGIKG